MTAPRLATLWLVVGGCGEYDMAQSWIVRAFDIEQAAKDFAALCEHEVQAAAKAWREVRGEWDNVTVDKRDAEIERRDALMPDKYISVDSFNSDEASYHVEEVPALLSTVASMKDH